jgi:hypothetical protein
MSTFRVGQKVVCINARPNGGWDPVFDHVFLARGAVYTISSVTSEFDVPAVQVAEINTEIGRHSGWFRAARFRPLVTQSPEHDVAAFRKIAGHVPVLDSEGA